MNAKIASFLLYLYPRAWRARYGDEWRALLERQPASPARVFDVVHGAIDARLHPHVATGRRPSTLSRVRAAAIAIFCAYAGFVLAYGFLQKLADPQAPFDAVAAAHGEVGVAFTAIVAGAVVALLAILVSGVPIGYAIVVHAIVARRRDILSLCAVPLVAVAALAVWTLLVARFLFPADHRSFVPTPLTVTLALSWIGVSGLAIIVSMVAGALAVVRSEISASLWRFTRAPATVAALSMAVTLTATVAWGASIRMYAPTLFDRDLGAAWFGVVVAVMVVATAVAGVALKRGYATRDAISAP